MSRPVERTDLSVGLNENRFTKLDVDDPGQLQVQYSARVETSPRSFKIDTFGSETVRTLDAVALPYLFPSRYAQADRMRAAAMDLFGHIQSKYEVAMAIEDWLFNHNSYQLGASAEQSWALDTFEKRVGVCRDLLTSASHFAVRSQSRPATAPSMPISCCRKISTRYSRSTLPGVGMLSTARDSLH